MYLSPKHMKYYGLGAIVLGIMIFLWWPISLTLQDRPYSSIVNDAQGRLLSAQIASDGQWRLPLSDSLPSKFVKCITTYEDKRFYWHIGVDPLAILRAIRLNIKQGSVISGASTIPMQILRLSNGNSKRSIGNKIKESLGALRLDAQYSKEDILKIYASHAPFGGNVVGLETAAWRYFDKDPHQLSWAEMASLAVLPNAPSLIRLDKNRNALLAKRNALLTKLYEQDILDDIELDLALSEPLGTGYYDLSNEAPHLLQLTKRMPELKEDLALKANLQVSVNDLLDRYYTRWSANGVHNAAVLIKHNETDQIIAYNANIPTTQHEYAIDMISAKRSSGSILKPILYAAAMQDGLIAPDHWLIDVPTYINGFTPTNYYDAYEGLVPASTALSMSLNVPFVRLLQQYGVDKFRRRLVELGLSSIDRSAEYYGLSLILGGAEVTLWDLVHSYSSMAQDLTRHNSGSHYDLGVIYETLQAMSTLKRPDGHGNWEQFNSSHKIAWKTGTSYGHRDAWAVGVTPEYTVGVWVGNADGEGREEIIGVSTAGSILFDVYDQLNISKPWFEEPIEVMEQVEVCAASGAISSRYCPETSYRSVPTSTLKTKACGYHQMVTVDTTHQWRMHHSCKATMEVDQKSFLKLSPHIQSYYQLRNPLYEPIPPLHPSCQSNDTGNAMEFVYPNANERIYLPRDLNRERQELIATLAHAEDDIEVYWYMNDQYLGSTKQSHSMSLSYPKGIYKLYCVDQHGSSVSRSFEIISQ